MDAKSTFLCLMVALCMLLSQCSNKVNPVEEFSDPKEFKQLLRTRTNVMVLFTQSKPVTLPIYKIYREAAADVRGIGTMVTVDCSGVGQKLCRQMKAAPDPYLLHHYKDGKFHKVYDRQEATKSLVRFMNDPTGDIPWDEDPSGKSVVHLENPSSLNKLLKKHKRVLIMFYAPWCVYCKQMKPEYAAAAAKVRASGLGILAAMDVVRPENAGMRTKYNITGFPTVHYFKNGEILTTYEGENKQDKIVEFMKDPLAAPAKPEEIPWSDEESHVNHLTDQNFDEFLKDNPSTLVMFYAPWCGHCKRLKPEWTKAAGILTDGVLAAVDATKEKALAARFKVKGFPTIKYFKNGEFEFDTPNLRSAKKIIEFLADPKEPPPAPPPDPKWEDAPSEVVHLTDETFKSQLRSKRHALVMFYAPWCGHCKAAKPEFEAAAEQLKDEPRMVLAAVNCVENTAICKQYEVSGYPTFKYLKYQKEATDYNGGRKAADFVNFMTSLESKSSMSFETEHKITHVPPDVKGTPAEQMALEQMMRDKATPDDFPGWDKLLHLTDENYKEEFVKHKRLFIMFHAKWCRKCKDVKPMFAEVALKHDPSLCTLAACDTDKAALMVDELFVASLPTFQYIRDGKSVANYTAEITDDGLREYLQRMKIDLKDEL